MPGTARTVDNSLVRERIAIWTLAVSGLGLLVLAGVSIWLSDATNRAETTRLVFASIVPLLGTWVGAVLAYYFSRENLQAGSDSALSAVRLGTGGPSADAVVTSVMIPTSSIKPILDVADDAAARTARLRDLYTTMTDAKQSRLPILTTATTALYVVHQADIEKYSQSQAVKASALPDGATLDTLLQTPDIAPQINSFVTVGPAETLGGARNAMSKVPEAKDVFVTADGQRAGVVLGWITNSDLVRAE